MKQNALLLVCWLFTVSISAQEVDSTKLEAGSNIDIPTFTLTEMDFEAEGQSQEISGLLQSSRDIFVSSAGFTFGPARFRIRGYDSENLAVLVGGVQLNDPETGRAYWSNWGGLNDATRNQDIKTGV